MSFSPLYICIRFWTIDSLLSSPVAGAGTAAAPAALQWWPGTVALLPPLPSRMVGPPPPMQAGRQAAAAAAGMQHAARMNASQEPVCRSQ